MKWLALAAVVGLGAWYAWVKWGEPTPPSEVPLEHRPGDQQQQRIEHLTGGKPM